MQRRWEKIKQKVTLGINAVQEKVGPSSIQEDESYLNLINQINDAGEKLNEIQKCVSEFTKSIEGYSNAQYGISFRISKLFKSGDKDYESSQATYKAQESLYLNGKSLSESFAELLNDQLVKEIVPLQEQLQKINDIADQRRKDHILLANSQKDLEKAKAKGKIKRLSRLQEIVATHQAKYTKSDNDFKQAANEYLSAAPSKYTAIFEAFQTYVAEFYEEGRKQALESIPNFKYDEIKAQRPSITIVPQVPNEEEEEKKE
ncbi:hypothetical protein TVAG_150730 [Trichomonas vaginalis G3]|uniref:BAR domain-containing protein n=1 Tax=Trichomonas vaginalis (strain ATCC PRA-98 / G3) TaxID=412133 RepID=A2DRX4_TRIV3|nr:arfaptin homology (AH) domain/bar domain domain-containing protein [Trichomonas vaginalis G3]EAY16921.1 hypothetical protein TVAG_150730 [Trichomonas vaginalis G3]KAI5489093.1 arfaptin homology (AH) domain/bar domain domain-containing protein [Trichomonas vaginalis G3]|eukprot:XP_001329144.1 hypothetical protein [Trichomonas vaginalis G3]